MSAGGRQRAVRLLLLAILLAGATGCRHKAKVAVVPIPPPKQLPVNTTAEVEPPEPMVQTVPLQPTPLPTVTVPAKRKKARRPRKAQVPPATVPAAAAGGVQTASVAAGPEASPIGALTPGGSDSSELHRQAVELIGTLEKRLAGLTPDTKNKQKDAIARVINFDHQAQTALAGGDSEGAVTLATKAKLLLDDLLK